MRIMNMLVRGDDSSRFVYIFDLGISIPEVDALVHATGDMRISQIAIQDGHGSPVDFDRG